MVFIAGSCTPDGDDRSEPAFATVAPAAGHSKRAEGFSAEVALDAVGVSSDRCSVEPGVAASTRSGERAASISFARRAPMRASEVEGRRRGPPSSALPSDPADRSPTPTGPARDQHPAPRRVSSRAHSKPTGIPPGHQHDAFRMRLSGYDEHRGALERESEFAIPSGRLFEAVQVRRVERERRVLRPRAAETIRARATDLRGPYFLGHVRPGGRRRRTRSSSQARQNCRTIRRFPARHHHSVIGRTIFAFRAARRTPGGEAPLRVLWKGSASGSTSQGVAGRTVPPSRASRMGRVEAALPGILER